MDQEQQKLVMPGDRLSAEEEYLPNGNAYAENGNIYAAVPGKPSIFNGKMGVKSVVRAIKKFRKDMFVTGSVVNEMPSVVFVELDSMDFGNVHYVPMKDGKIVLRVGRPGRGFRDERPNFTQYKQGDVLLAKIAYDDPGIYTLEMRERETGVVYATCELCNSTLQVKETNTLVCETCKHIEQRRVSSLYNNFKEIYKFLESNYTK